MPALNNGNQGYYSPSPQIVTNLPMYVDGVKVTATVASIVSSNAPSSYENNHWASTAAHAISTTEEVLEITYGSERIINKIDFQALHVPCDIRAEYIRENSTFWSPLVFSTGNNNPGGPISSPSGGVGEVYETITDSVPQVISYNRQQYAEQPSGSDILNVWHQVSWHCTPATAVKIRIIFLRRVTRSLPVDANGRLVSYSVGCTNFKASYLIETLYDIPRTKVVESRRNTTFSQSQDALGSTVSYSLYQDPASNVLRSVDSNVYWKCNPQPINTAVVNFFTDMRNSQGNGQVVDRFYIDPLTTGPNMNIYYSNDDLPTGSATAVDEVLAYPVVQVVGTQPRYITYGSIRTGNNNYFDFPDEQFCSMSVDNSYIHFDVTSPWWVGLDIISHVDYSGAASTGSRVHPILSIGNSYLVQQNNTFVFTNEIGQKAYIPFPAGFNRNTRYQLLLSYTPVGHYTEAGQGVSGLDGRLGYPVADLIEPPVGWTDGTYIPAGYSLWIKSGNNRAQAVSYLLSPPTSAVDFFHINSYPVGHSLYGTNFGGLNIVSMVLKDIPLSFSQISEYYAYGSAYNATVEFPSERPQTTDGALFRIHPQFQDDLVNPQGIVGGRRNAYDGLSWTPVARDYSLRKGFAAVPPTNAKFWKFEFTNLVAQTYEASDNVYRSVRVFPTYVIRQYEYFQYSGFWNVLGSLLFRPFINLYGEPAIGDAYGYNRYGSTAADALVYASSGILPWYNKYNWLQNFRRWHVGYSAPFFYQTGVHAYEVLEVKHQNKLAYFVGLKQLVAYRTDYLIEDDTVRYYDSFLDNANLDLTQTQGITSDSLVLQSQGNYGTAQSQTLPSTRPVRGLQFATVESEPGSLLSDDFSDPVLSNHWRQYGDATAHRTNDARVLITRGFVQSYYSTFEAVRTYGSLDGKDYGSLEGKLANGVAGGGLSSASIFPSNAGRIIASAQVSATSGLSGPMVIQIVSETGAIVLNEQQVSLSQGGQTLLSVDYQPGSATTGPSLYQDMQNLGAYSAIEGSTYGSHERLVFTGRVYARVFQRGATSDKFTVIKMSIFDQPIEWSFSVDNGLSWYVAFGIKNKTSGVLSFPQSGKQLRWRVKMFTARSTVSALAIRPWYGNTLGIDSNPARSAGPNNSTQDEVPLLTDDPMWKQWDSPLPQSWVQPLPSLQNVQILPTVGPDLTP